MMATVLTPSGRKLSLPAPAWRRSVNKQPEARVSSPYDACDEQGGTPDPVVAFSSHFRVTIGVNRAFLRDVTTNREV